jgi:protein SCO1/2
MRTRVAILALLALLAGSGRAAAHDETPPALRDVGFEQRLDAPVPLDAVLRDERGRAVTLGALLGGRPAVMSLNQYECGHLCPFVLEGLARVMRETPLALGNAYVAITVGIDPREDAAVAARKKAAIVAGFLPQAKDGWHFLTGDEATVRRIARAVGFKYTYDRQQDEYAHPTGVVVLTPAGHVARYLFGMDFAARDLRLALTEAAHGRIGGVVEQILLACYRYDVVTGRYTPLVTTALRAGGALTLAGLGALLLVLFRGERRRRP